MRSGANKLPNNLVIMAKQPSAGRVKTRLARDIGASEALRFYRHQLNDTCRRLGRDPRWHSVLARSPDQGCGIETFFVDEVTGQGGGDLGIRMQCLFERFGHGPLIIIGADIPGITRDMVARAFQALKSHEVVFGPASDGGYWLVGQRRRPRTFAAFADVRWSSDRALADTVANLKDSSVAYIDELNDIDTGADYASRIILPGTGA